MSWYPIGRPIGTTTYPGMQYLCCKDCGLRLVVGVVGVLAWIWLSMFTFSLLSPTICA